MAQLDLDYQMAVLTVSPRTDAASLLGGLERAYRGKAYLECVASLLSGDGNNPQSIQGPGNIEALRLDYQLAARKASQQTRPSAGVIGGADQAIFGRNTVSSPTAGFRAIPRCSHLRSIVGKQTVRCGHKRASRQNTREASLA